MKAKHMINDKARHLLKVGLDNNKLRKHKNEIVTNKSYCLCCLP